MKIINITFLAVLFITVSCKNKTESSVEITSENTYDLSLTSAQMAQGKINLDSIKQKEIDTFIELPGQIEIPAASKAEVTPLISGNVLNINLIEGQKVSKGSTLIQIKSPDLVQLQQDFASHGAELIFLKNDYERQHKLFTEKVIAEKKYLLAESAYKSSLAQYNGLKQKLIQLHINPAQVLSGNLQSSFDVKAPISGTITDIQVVNGSYVKPGDVLCKIYDKSKVLLAIKAFEKDLKNIKAGQKIMFYTSDNQPYNAEVHLISPALDPESKSVLVHANILDKGNFYEGTYVISRIITHAKMEWVVPLKAIISVADKNFVFVLDKQEGDIYHFNKEPITVKYKNDTYAILSNNPFKDKQIISNEVFMLTE